MIKLVNFDECKDSFYDYGGAAGKKRGIIYNGENYLVKYPNSTEGMRDIASNFKYSTSPLSEYLGSHIYETIGLEVHKTLLGKSGDKLVVACKDFRKENEQLVDFQSISNKYSTSSKNSSSLSGNSDNLDEIINLMEENEYFLKYPKLKTRFWDMFVVDAFIGNNDRNNGNWGIIKNYQKKEIRLAPIYDNGASFNNKADDERLKKILSSKERFVASIYEGQVCHFYDNSKLINPLKYIESMQNEECNKAVIRIFKKIDLDKIKNIFNNLPENEENIEIISNMRKEFYLKTLEYRYENILKPVYEKLK